MSLLMLTSNRAVEDELSHFTLHMLDGTFVGIALYDKLDKL